ncbi:hypothetical protein [Streptomyces sp. NPDC003077]|uniref:hypothetical protein n=1 Tax=Streptomyces sp. NPDC003077 TaxID=3154443 RepID=UPI0033A38C1A
MPFIDRYTRRDGTQVSAHSRSAPGSRRQLTIMVVIVLLIWGASEGGLHIKGTAGHRPAVTAPAHPAGGAR